MTESRLRRNIKRKAIHNVILVVVGFIALLAILVFFGSSLLTGYSLLVEKFQGSDASTSSTNTQSDSYVAPPTLNPAADATNSAQITVYGFAQKDQTVSLYLNNQMIDKTSVDDKNNFHFNGVELQQGQNNIQAKAESKNKESGFSNTIIISFVKNPPSLSIDNPQDGQAFSKNTSPTVGINGQTDTGDKVTVNGFWAIVDDQGKYNYLYTLQDGDNDIKVVSTDDAGNQTTKEIHIHTQ